MIQSTIFSRGKIFVNSCLCTENKIIHKLIPRYYRMCLGSCDSIFPSQNYIGTMCFHVSCHVCCHVSCHALMKQLSIATFLTIIVQQGMYW